MEVSKSRRTEVADRQTEGKDLQCSGTSRGRLRMKPLRVAGCTVPVSKRKSVRPEGQQLQGGKPPATNEKPTIQLRRPGRGAARANVQHGGRAKPE